jgi:molybdenum cofactor cytidylyltransferase
LKLRSVKSPRGILLAAGASSRFGANKLMHPMKDGTPLALASARNLLVALPGSLAVVRPGRPELEALLREAGCEVTVCERADEGMGLSLAHAIGASRDAPGWVVALADMPYIRPATIKLVAQAVQEAALIATPVLGEARGHPVGFSAALREELLGLQGDEGARSVLKRHVEEVRRLPVDDPGILRDIDTPADLSQR